MDFTIYEVHVWMQENGNYWWEAVGAYENHETAFGWYKKYKAGGQNVKIIKTQITRVWEDGKEYIYNRDGKLCNEKS